MDYISKGNWGLLTISSTKAKITLFNYEKNRNTSTQGYFWTYVAVRKSNRAWTRRCVRVVGFYQDIPTHLCCNEAPHLLPNNASSPTRCTPMCRARIIKTIRCTHAVTTWVYYTYSVITTPEKSLPSRRPVLIPWSRTE